MGVDGQEGGDQPAYARFGLQRFGGDFADDQLETRDVRRRDLDQQLLLVLHVVVERRLRDAAGFGHVVHGRRRVALAGEEARRTREDLPALPVVA